MRVALTGYTPISQNSRFRRTNYWDLPHSMREALEASGHEVFWGKPLEAVAWKPDFMFIGACDPRAIVANGIYDCAWAIEQHEQRVGGGRWAFDFPDWRIPACLKGHAYFLQRPDYLEHPSHPQRKEMVKTSPDGHRPLERLMVRLASGDWPPVVIDAFEFGDDAPMLVNKLNFGPKSFVRVQDLAYYPVHVQQVPPSNRERRHSYAVLWKYNWWLEKQNFTWPVDVLGDPKRLLEQELLLEYEKRWSILAPPYDFRSSGLTRPRYWHAAKLGLVIMSEPTELTPWLPSFGVSLAEIEAMSPGELATLAAHQGAELLGAVGPKEKLQHQLDGILSGRVTSVAPPLAV